MLRVNIIGIGPGNPDLLTVAAQKAIAESTILAGDQRMLAQVDTTGKRVEPTIKLAVLAQLAAEADPERDVLGVLVSGDVGFYSLAQTITGRLPNCICKRYAGISSAVYFAAALNLPWQDAHMMSMHGRQQHFVEAVFSHHKVFTLTDPDNSPRALCQQLVAQGLGDCLVHVGENLSYPEERIVSGTAAELAQQDFAKLAVMYVLNSHPQAASGAVHGLDDESFIRGKAPMTKQEVRALSVSKLAPRRSDVIYDIGAGTGSCSIEFALQAPYGEVYAFEQKEDALALLAQNKERFGCDNLTIVAGEASEHLTEYPVPDCVFIGGSSGNLDVFLDTLYARNPRCRIVLNAITLETLAQVVDYYQAHPAYTLDVVSLSAAANKKLGRYNLMMARNPVFIMTAVPVEQ